MEAFFLLSSQANMLFQNLITNGLTYNDSDVKEVIISHQESTEYYEFSVRDNGIGIDPVYYNRIFKMFQRLHRKDVYEGTGVGLAICKRIVENHGGQIGIESSEAGTVFSFSISKRLR